MRLLYVSRFVSVMLMLLPAWVRIPDQKHGRHERRGAGDRNIPLGGTRGIQFADKQAANSLRYKIGDRRIEIDSLNRTLLLRF